MAKTFRLTKPMPAGLIAGAAGLAAALATWVATLSLVDFGDRWLLALPLGAPAFTIFFVPLFIVLRRLTVELVADGLFVRSLLGRSRFVPYESIVIVRAAGPAIVLALRGEREERFEVRPEHLALTEGGLAALRHQEAQSIAAQINDARRYVVHHS